MDKIRRHIIAVIALFFLIAVIIIFYTVRQKDQIARFTPLDFSRCAHVAWTLLCTLVLFWAAWAPGVWLLGRFRLPQLTPLENALFSLGIGFSSLIALGFAMAALGLYQISVLIVILIALFVAFSRFALCRDALAARLCRAGSVETSRRDVSTVELWFRRFAIVVLIILLLPNFLSALAPPNSWDEIVYHLVIPKTYIEHGGFARLDYLVYFDIPHNINLLYGFSLMARSPESAHLVHFAFGIMTAGLLIAFCRRFYGEASGWFASLIFLTTPVVMLETRAAMVDVALAFFFLAAVYAVFLWSETGNRRFITLAALFAGIAMGSKYQGIYVFLTLVAMLLIVSAQSEKMLSRQQIRLGGIFIALGALLISPWLIKNTFMTGNPVYPNLYHIFDGKDWSPQLADHLHAWLQSMGMGRSVHDFLFLPWRLTVRGAYNYSRFSGMLSPFYFFTLPLLLFVLRRPRITLRLLVLFAVYLTIWFFGSQQVRFLIPALPLLAIVSGDALAQLFQKGRFVNTKLLCVIVFILVGLVSISADLSDVYLVGPNVSRVFGAEDRDDFLIKARGVDIHPMICYMNANLPRDARILMLFDNRGYYLERRYIADGTFEVSRILPWFTDASSPRETLALLKRHGITHVLINETYALPYFDSAIGEFYPTLGDKLDDFKQSCVRQVERIGNVVLFELLDNG